MVAHIFNTQFSPLQPFVIALGSLPYLFTAIEFFASDKKALDSGWFPMAIKVYTAVVVICELMRFSYVRRLGS